MKNQIEKEVLKEIETNWSLTIDGIFNKNNTQICRKDNFEHLLKIAIKLAQQKKAQTIFDKIEKKCKYKLNNRTCGQGSMISIGEKRWKEFKNAEGVK